MRKTRVLLILAMALVAGACGSDAPPTTDPAAPYEPYGTAFAPEGAVPVQAVAAEPAPYVGQPVKIEGTVREVCQMKGCWLTLDAGEGDPIRIHVARTERGDYAFTVPKDLSGRHVVVQGVLEETVLGAEEQRHLAEDGAPAADTASYRPQRVLQVTAQGVLVEKART